MALQRLRINLVRNIFLRILSCGVIFLAVRFAYLVTLAGGSCGSDEGFCFFPENVIFAGNSDRRFRHSSAVTSQPSARDLWTTKKWRKSVDYYSSIFQDFVAEGFLSRNSKALCIETFAGEDVLALKEIGVFDSVGISKNTLPPLIISGEAHRQPFNSNTYDFEFAGNGCLDRSVRPVDFAGEVGRTLKPGGFLVLHTMARDFYSFNSVLDLFNCCKLIKTRELTGIDSPSIREIVLKKEIEALPPRGNSGNKCSVPGYKLEIIENLEPLIEQEPLKPWITFRRNKKNIKYLTSMVDISFKQRYVYIDVGARTFSSSIGNWFLKHYPKQNKTFQIYAIEAEKSFNEEYKTKKDVVFLPYAAWLRNETLFFEIKRERGKKIREKRRGIMGRIQPVMPSRSYMGDVDKILGFDFANWLKKTVGERDFVVVKMDVEGSEFYLIPRLIETGAICLVDEIFLECHYNRMERCRPGRRSGKYNKSYGHCLEMFSLLRETGVLVHQWF
ncbi:hypothetical protein UlMin_013057 [Ulmus minor]